MAPPPQPPSLTNHLQSHVNQMNQMRSIIPVAPHSRVATPGKLPQPDVAVAPL